MTSTASRPHRAVATSPPARGAYHVLKEEPVGRFSLGPPQSKVLFPVLLAVTVATVIFFLTEPQLGAVVVPMCAYVQAFRLSRLRGRPGDVREMIAVQSISLAAFALTTLIAYEFTKTISDIWLVGSIANFAYVIATLGTAVFFLFVVTAKWLAKPPPSKALPRVVVSVATLRDWRNENYADLKSLTQFEVFTAAGPGLADAWHRKALKEIEEYLKAGDALTRRNAAMAVEIYNRIVGRVDLARGNLKYQVELSEAALAPFKIDYSAIKPDQSASMIAIVPIVALRHDLSQHLNHGAVAGRLGAEAMRGNVPWYVAAAALAGAIVMDEINKSKKLRQLKGMEGQLLATAEVVKSDFVFICRLLLTRVIPQYNALLDIISRLNSGLPALQSLAPNSIAAQERAFDLACALVEGKRYLRMMGGD